MNNGQVYGNIVTEVDDVADLKDEGEGHPAERHALFGTPARAITIAVAVLVLFLLTGTVAWLFGSRSNEGG